MNRGNYLFMHGDLSRTLDTHRRKLCDQVAALTPSQIVPPNDVKASEHFTSEFSIASLQLHEEGLELLEPREIEREESGDYGRSFKRKLLEFRFEMPFSGEANLFQLRGSTCSLSPPEAQVVGNHLVVTIVRGDRDKEGLTRQLEATIASIKQHIGWQQQQIDGWNQSLPGLVSQVVSARRDKLLADRQLVSELPYRIRKRDEVSSYTFPVHRKSVSPPLPTSKAGPLAPPEPALDAAIYEDILETLGGMSVVMERCPSAFVNLDEEALRMQFLIPLNSKFQGMASGETFNASGKTDILIKHRDRILFVAECKFWKGAQSLSDAIDQLLGYLTWRETKGAILLFNRNRDFSAVLAQIPEVIRSHSHFVRLESYEKSTGFRFVVRHPNDPIRHLLVTVLAFDVPQIS